jgi:hypothetical protein
VWLLVYVQYAFSSSVEPLRIATDYAQHPIVESGSGRSSQRGIAQQDLQIGRTTEIDRGICKPNRRRVRARPAIGLVVWFVRLERKGKCDDYGEFVKCGGLCWEGGGRKAPES